MPHCRDWSWFLPRASSPSLTLSRCAHLRSCKCDSIRKVDREELTRRTAARRFCAFTRTFHKAYNGARTRGEQLRRTAHHMASYSVAGGTRPDLWHLPACWQLERAEGELNKNENDQRFCHATRRGRGFRGERAHCEDQRKNADRHRYCGMKDPQPK